jgi:hypothetical protein
MLAPMGDILKLIWWVVIGLFRSRSSLEAESLTLRHQLNVLRRKSPKRFAFSNFDRLIFAGLYQLAPRIVNALVIGDCDPLASCWVLLVLVMEVASSRRQTEGGARNPAIDPRHEPRQPAVGRSPDPWRTAQARYRRGSNLGRQIHGKAQEAPIPRVEESQQLSATFFFLKSGGKCVGEAAWLLYFSMKRDLNFK